MPKTFANGKKSPLNMRTTHALREKIEAACTVSGRSLVQEVEYRLERSFWEDEARGEVDILIKKARLLALEATGGFQ